METKFRLVIDTELLKRFGQLLELLGTDIRELANETSQPESRFYQFTAKRQNLSLQTIQAILKKYPQISGSWLVAGVGSPTRITEAGRNKEDEEAFEQIEQIARSRRRKTNPLRNES